MYSIPRALALFALFTAGCGGGVEPAVGEGVPVPADEGAVLARVGEAGGVTAEVFAQAAARTPPANGEAHTLDERKAILEELIADEALFQEAARQGLLRDPRIRRSLVNLLLKEEVTRQVESSVFTNEQLRAYYDTHRDEFIIPENVHVMRIFLSVGDKRSAAEAQALAADLRGQIVADPDRFKELAMEHSEDPYTRRGGDLGYLTEVGKPGVDPKVVEVAFELDVGEVSEPFEGGGGYNLVYVPKKRDKIERTFEQMKGSVLRKLKNERHQELSEAYVQRVRERYPVTLDEKALASVPVEPIRSQRVQRPGLPLKLDKGAIPSHHDEDEDH